MGYNMLDKSKMIEDPSERMLTQILLNMKALQRKLEQAKWFYNEEKNLKDKLVKYRGKLNDLKVNYDRCLEFLFRLNIKQKSGKS